MKSLSKKMEYFKAEKVELINSGSEYFETLIALIDQAEQEIHLQTYIFLEDSTGHKIASALIRAVKRGVKVYVLADAYGSKSLSETFILNMIEAGIFFRFFSPLFSTESIYLGRRLHHKIAVADGTIALVGGINIADKYHGSIVGPAWLDYAVLINGEVCVQLIELCRNFYDQKLFLENNFNRNPSNGNIPVRFSRNDWVKGKNSINKSYYEALKNAKDSVIFVASYFLPSSKFLKALKRAGQRGVKIKVILAGKSDVPFFWFAEKYLYDFYLRNGIEIYEWKDSVLHGKVLIADSWTSIGSYNHNHLSHYLSIELNVEIKDKDFTSTFKKKLEEMMQTSCEKIGPKYNLHASNLLLRLRNYIAYMTYKLLMKLFLNRPEKKHPGKLSKVL